MQLAISEGFIEWRESGPGVIELTNWYVNPQSRRQGFGHKLLEMALAEIGPVTTIYLFTEMSNTGAHLFFEALEFSYIVQLNQWYNHDGMLLYVRQDAQANRD